MKICNKETKPNPIAFIPGNIYQMKPNHCDYNCTSGRKEKTSLCKHTPYLYTNDHQLVNLVSGHYRNKEDAKHWYDATDKWCVKEITQ